MPKLSRKAGQNIRELSLNRRIKSITSFISAGFVIFIPFFMAKTFESFFKQISSLNFAQSQSLYFSPAYYILFGVIALGLVANGVYFWKRANHADQGAKGEEDMAQEMQQLETKGWEIEYGMRLRGLGDVDIVCISPQNKAYVIEVKSHRGEVTTDGKKLYRRMGKISYPFEKNFLEQAIKQALQVKKKMKLSFVTPIVAFSDAKVLVPPDKLQNVYVVGKSSLVSLLESLG
jgi:hypothetical protein